MKKTDYQAVSGVVVGFVISVILISLMFKILHWPGGTGMMLISAVLSFILSIFVLFSIPGYSVLSDYVAKGVDGARQLRLTLMASAVAVSVLSVGVVFRLLHWPYGAILLIISLLTLSWLAILAGFFFYQMHKNLE